MSKITIKYIRKHSKAIAPTRATPGSACFDLYAVDADAAGPSQADQSAAVFRTGIAIEVPPGYALEIYSRSGHGFRHATRLSNCVGLIDSDYRGEIMVALRADGRSGINVSDGDRIAQAKLVKVPEVEFVEVEELGSTERGEKGFGSTGMGALNNATRLIDARGYTRDDDTIKLALEMVGLKHITKEMIAAWTLEQCIEVSDWARTKAAKLSPNDGVVVRETPAVIRALLQAPSAPSQLAAELTEQPIA
ncbi:dUTP diphosphatase [Burkholderia gladioli]|uniref:dUTP diphosphatase n=1 Tax=Burkholderia gladioli TaxID=28095 RepID=UPI0016417A30|nr:dUTP diphosphatase [Burkholderia gladioli]